MQCGGVGWGPPLATLRQAEPGRFFLSSEAAAEAVAHLQDDVVEADEVLRLGAPLALVGLGLLQLGVQSVSHALVPLHQRAQLDVAQVTARRRGADVTAEYNLPAFRYNNADTQ